jgi:SOS-response transcriptional repressor LexA
VNWELYREKLAAGEEVSFRPRGNSMKPRICSGQLVTVSPCEPEDVQKGDVVFCKVKGNYYVHLVQSVKQKTGGFRFQIGNMKKHTNGTIGHNALFGKVTKVEP